MRFILCWLLLVGLVGVSGSLHAEADVELEAVDIEKTTEILEEQGLDSPMIYPRSDERSSTSQRRPDFGAQSRWSSTDFIIIFVLLVGAGALALYLRQRGVPWKAFGQKADSVDRKLELVEMKNLGGKQFLVVARYEQKRFLLGVYPGRVDFLCWLSGEDRDAPPPDLAGISSQKEEES